MEESFYNQKHLEDKSLLNRSVLVLRSGSLFPINAVKKKFPLYVYSHESGNPETK